MSKILKVVLISIVALFFFVPVVFAASSKIIFDQDYLADAASVGVWQIFNNTDESLYLRDGGLLLKSDGDAYLVYNGQFNYHQYDRLKLTVTTNRPLRLTLIPNVSTTGFNTYELRRRIETVNQPTVVDVSLRLPFFKDTINDLGINFYSAQPADIIISKITLEKFNSAELLLTAVKDYFRVFEYSPFTVNLFAAPRVLGRSALAYLLPFIIVLILLAVFSRKWRRLVLVALFVIWLVTDIRMMYEFFSYHVTDYYDYVKPPAAEKQLRNYADFYQFADWTADHLESEQEVNFYKFGSAHFPRLLQYLTYPLVINDEGSKTKTYLVYNRKDISYNESDQSLYLNGSAMTGAGEIVGRYNAYSFIFQEK